MYKKKLTLGAAALTFAAALPATPASAALPQSVRAMLDAAITTADPDKVATVADLARKLHPEDTAEINAMEAAFNVTQQILADEAAKAEEEKIRSAGLLDNWHGTGQIGAFKSTGNTKDTGLTAGISLERVGIKWRHKLSAIADYQKTNGVKTRDQFLASYEPNYQIDDRLYAYGFAQYERDRFGGFDSRIAASGGFGYRAIDKENMQLSLKAGPAWRKTKFTDGTSTSDIAELAALDFAWQISDTLRFTENASAFIQTKNTTLTSNTGLEAKLGGNLTARLAYVIEHDTDPPVGSVKTDTLTRATLIYGF